MTREDEHLIYQIFLPFSEGREEWRNRLPHLTSSDMVNVQLYALLGVVLRQFVQSWHNAIVEDDTFVFTILETLSKTIREVEQRVSKCDLDRLVLDDLPYLVHSHIKDYFLAREKMEVGVYECSIVEAFGRLRPHIALANEQNEQLYLKVLSDRLTKIILKDETLDSETARSLIASILNSIVFRNAINLLSQPWMLHDIILKLLDPPVSSIPPQRDATGDSSNGNQEERTETSWQSTFWKEGNETFPDQVKMIYARIIQTGGNAIAKTAKLLMYIVGMYNREVTHSRSVDLNSHYIIGMMREMMATYTEKPLAIASLSALLAPLTRGKLGIVANSLVSRFLTNTLRREDFVAKVLQTARNALFPSGYMGPPRVVPTEGEQQVLRARVLEHINKKLGRFAPAGSDSLELLLSVFDDARINKYLVFNLFELLILEAFPELAV